MSSRKFDELMKPRRGYVHGKRGHIHYATAGNGEPLLLIHQSAQSWRIYARLVNIMSANYQVIAMDMPGFGDSDPLPAPFEISDLVEVVVDLLDNLKIRKAYVSGHHSGSVICGELAVSHPERVFAAALSGYPYRTDAERQKAIEDIDKPREQPVAPRFYLKADGSHLFRVFERVSMRRWQGKVSAAGGKAPFPNVVLPFDQPQAKPEYTFTTDDLELINESMVDNLQSAIHGGMPTHRAVTMYDPRTRLPLLKVPTMVIQSSGPFESMFMQRGDMVQKLIPGGQLVTIENGDVFVAHSRAQEYSEVLHRFFQGIKKA